MCYRMDVRVSHRSTGGGECLPSTGHACLAARTSHIHFYRRREFPFSTALVESHPAAMAENMGSQNKAVSLLLLFISLTGLPHCVRPSLADGPPLDKPFNLTVESYNFNTTLCWNHNSASNRPYFSVGIRDQNDWIVVQSCRKILHHCCDVSEKIVDAFQFYDLKVKAFTGDKTSEEAKFTEFNLINNGVFGPPSVNASVKDKMIIVDIWHPYVPFIDGKKTVADYFEDIKYNISFGNESEVTDNCDEIGCTATILTAGVTGTYCISATGISDTPVIFETSKPICIEVHKSDVFSKQIAIIVASVISALLVLVLLAICVFRKMTKTKTKVPESLSAVARSVATRFTFLEQRTKYDHVCVTPAESPEEKKTEPEDTHLDINASHESVSRESGPGYRVYQSSLSETEQKSDEDQDGGAEEGSSTNTYSHTSNNNNDTNDSSLTPESGNLENVTKQEPTRDVKPVAQSFGYDKPHVPLDVIIQMNKENYHIESKNVDL